MGIRKNFFERLGEHREGLTKKQLKVAEYISQNYKTAVFLSSVELGKEAGTSEATVVRLANALGYQGFLEMIKEIQDYIKDEITTIDKLEKMGDIYKDKSVIEEVMINNQLIIKSLRKYVGDKTIKQAVKDISTHRRLIIAGFESSAGIAEYIGYNFSRIHDQIEIVTHNHSNLFNVVSNVDKDTFVMLLSFPRYAKSIVKLAELFQNNGARMMAVTDSRMAPLNTYSDYAIILPVHDNYIANLDVSVGVMTIFQSIMLQYASENYNKVQKKLQKLEAFNETYEMFTKK